MANDMLINALKITSGYTIKHFKAQITIKDYYK